jgi:hypothetical protein
LTTPKPSFRNVAAPSIADLDLMAQSAFAALPEDFRRLCDGVVISVEDFPDDETLDEMNCASEFDLLGLFRGRGRAQSEATPMTGQFQTWYGSTAARSSTSGLSTKRRSAPSSPMFWCTKSAIISGYPTKICR